MPTMLKNEHVYEVTPPAKGEVHVKQHEPLPNKRGDQAGLDIEAGRQHKFVPFNEYNPDPMKLPRDHHVTIMSGDRAYSYQAGQLQDMQKAHPKQQVFARMAESIANSNGKEFDVKAFEAELARADRGAHEVPERRRPHHPLDTSVGGKRVHVQAGGVHLDVSHGMAIAGAAVGLAVAAKMTPEARAACANAIKDIADKLNGTMVDVGKGGGCFGLAPNSGKSDGHGANVNGRQ